MPFRTCNNSWKGVFIAQVTKTDKEKSSYKPSQQQGEVEILFHSEFFPIIEIVKKSMNIKKKGRKSKYRIHLSP